MHTSKPENDIFYGKKELDDFPFLFRIKLGSFRTAWGMCQYKYASQILKLDLIGGGGITLQIDAG